MKKIFAFAALVLLFALCMAVSVACSKDPVPDDGNTPGSGQEQTGGGEEETAAIATFVYGDVRVQLLSPSLVRIEQKGEKGFEDRESYYVVNRSDWSGVTYTEQKGDDETVITTEKYAVHIPQGASAEEVYVTQAGGNGAALYEYAGNVGANVYLPSPSDELKSWYFTDSPRIIPSEEGYAVSEEDLPMQGWDFDNDATDIFVFLPDGDYAGFCRDWVDLIGQSEMVSLKALGYWDSRWYADSAETALKRITDYLDRGYSIDVVVIDVDYKDSEKNGQWGVGYEINEDLFPDMTAFLEECHELGVSVVFNDHPIPAEGTGNLLDTDEIEYRTDSLTCFLAMGVDYWWYDRNWDAALNEIDPDISVYATGMYAFQFITKEYYESIADVGEYARRALIMANVDGLVNGKWMYASDASAHRYSIQWTGDIDSGSEDLAYEIYNAVFGGAEVGLPYVSCDLGGFKSAVSDEQYIRWFQYCALSSIVRAHVNTGGSGQMGRMPWLFGETAEEVAHVYQDMRYRLLPLYYYLSYRNYSEGLPVMSRTDILYPEYAEASANDQYLLGDYILVAPIAEAEELQTVPSSMLYTMQDGQRKTGLRYEYYNKVDQGGTLVSEGIAETIYFDWGKGGPAGLPTDNFSARYSGYVTFDERACLRFFADDSVKVLIDDEVVIDSGDKYDTYFDTPYYEAGSTHKIEVLYTEDGDKAHIYMYLVDMQEDEEITNSREVFIPDGTWIDVWTGERYVGPATYTVTHTLRTSPIFVREGALVLLSQNAQNVSSVLWDELTLDVYPSANYSAETTLYEDDTDTIAYKDGQYRTTDVSMTCEDGVLKIVIDPAKGSFEGERAFSDRTWNLRIHRNPDWGTITAMRVNGEAIDFDVIERSASAAPFAFAGAALDGDVYVVSLRSPVSKGMTIEIEWSAAADSASNADYDRTALDFDLSVSEAGDGAVLDKDTVDWVSYGTAQDLGSEYISYPESYDTSWAVSGVFFCSEYRINGETVSDLSAIASNMNFDFEVETIGKPAYYVFYFGGEYCTAKVTVRDRAGNVRTAVFGNMEGSFTQRVVVYVNDPASSTFYLTYAVMASEPSGTGTKSVITAIAATISEELPAVSSFKNNVTVGKETIENAERGTLDLTNDCAWAGEKVADWMHFEQRGISEKTGADVILGASFVEEGVMYDFPIEMSYSDGTLPMDSAVVRQGRFSVLGDVTVSLSVTPENKHIVLYTGVYKATAYVEVYTAGGELLLRTDAYTASGSSAVCKVVSIPVDIRESGTLIVKIVCDDPDTVARGNVSLAAAVVTSTIG